MPFQAHRVCQKAALNECIEWIAATVARFRDQQWTITITPVSSARIELFTRESQPLLPYPSVWISLPVFRSYVVGRDKSGDTLCKWGVRQREILPSISIKLALNGRLSTFTVQLRLSKSRKEGWRTRGKRAHEDIVFDSEQPRVWSHLVWNKDARCVEKVWWNGEVKHTRV